VLETMQNVSIKTSNKFTLITICNWETYQNGNSDGVQLNVPKVSSKCPASVQQVSTNKNDKNEKKDEKTASAAKAPAKPRKPNPYWDEVCRVFGMATVTQADGKRIGKLVRDFTAKCKYDGVGPEEISVRREHLIEKWGDPDKATVDATLKHWDMAKTGKAQAIANVGPDGEFHLDPNDCVFDEEFVGKIQADIRAEREAAGET